MCALMIGAGVTSVYLVPPPSQVSAQKVRNREAYLIKLLRTSTSFRVRAQAALSLGRFKSTASTQKSLQSALNDKHPAVRIAAAGSLGQLGDAQATSALRSARKDKNAKVRKAVRKALKQLANAGSGSQTKAKYYVAVGLPGALDSLDRAVRDKKARQKLQKFLGKEVARLDGIMLAKKGESARAARKVLKKRKLRGYYLSSSITKFSTAGGDTKASVSVTVNTYPERDMRLILQGSASVKGSTSAASRRAVLEAAFKGALSRLHAGLEAVSDR